MSGPAFSFDAQQRRAISTAIARPASQGLLTALESCVARFKLDRECEAADADEGFYPGHAGLRRELARIRAAAVDLNSALACASGYTLDLLADGGGWGGSFHDWRLRVEQLYRVADDLVGAKPRERPGPKTNTSRHHFEIDVAGSLLNHGVPVTGYANGPYAKVLAIALRAATGERLPDDPRQILRRVVPAARRSHQRLLGMKSKP